MTAVGLRTMLGVQRRTRGRGVVVWVVALAASLVGTALAVAGLYDTPDKIHSYAVAVTSGSALVAINGRVAGIDSLGGVIADEFGFLAAFLLPLLGIALVAGSTRREEESGRLEGLLAGRVARHTPVLAAQVLALATTTATACVFALGLLVAGVPLTGSIGYAASLGTLALVFAALASLVAQLTLHGRGVYAWSLGALAIAYLLRGVGDVRGSWAVWLSPLGWAERVAPFAAIRWWVLLVPLAVSLALAGAALAVAARRDVGSAVLRRGPGPANASAWLRGPLGLAARVHLPALFGWLAGGLTVAAMMGSLARQLLDAATGNAAMGAFIGVGGGHVQDGLIAVTQLYLAVIASGYAVHAVGVVRGEEAEGRLEPQLAGTLSRTRWLGSHTIVVTAHLTAIVVVCSLVLGLSAAWSLGDPSPLGTVLGAGLAYLPAELTVGALALALFGSHPRVLPVAWAVFAGIATVAFLGAGLRWPGWVLDLSPTTHVGNPPVGPVRLVPLAVLSAVALALGIAAFAAFRGRSVPQG